MRVADLLDVAYALGVDILAGAARETVDEGKVAFLHALCGNLEIFLRLVRNVVLRVWCRVVILVGVYTEH